MLTSGGHNAGIVSEPGYSGRHFRIARRAAGQKYSDPDTWAEVTPVTQVSWWPAWANWLESQSGGRIAAPAVGAPANGYLLLGAAPGHYVLER